MKRPSKYRCSNPWTTLFVWGNGDVSHCCYSNIGPIGNIRQNSLEEIWNSRKLNKIRKAIHKGNYVKAGCEGFCRAHRWSTYYKGDMDIQIPDGLGRSDIQNFETIPEKPKIISLAMDWKCNMHCTHCRAGRTSKGLSEKQIDQLWPSIEDAEIVRLSNGEFTINKNTLGYLERISTMEKQPLVFMNTNGHYTIDKWFASVQNLQGFHLKFSLEGLKDDYNKVRIGGDWENYYKNLKRAIVLFEEEKEKGKDWKLYLNFCVMKSNFFQLKDVVAFSIQHQIRLVVNPIHGMRHTEENIFAYEHLRIPDEIINAEMLQIRRLIENSEYIFSAQLLQYLDYIEKYAKDSKYHIPKNKLVKLKSKYSDATLDRLLSIFYKWHDSKYAFMRYVYHKGKLKLGMKYK